MKRYIYFLYCGTEIVYIGFTENIRKRITQHKTGKSKKNFDSFKFFELEYYNNMGLFIESQLIKMFKPVLNTDYAKGEKPHWASIRKQEKLKSVLKKAVKII